MGMIMVMMLRDDVTQTYLKAKSARLANGLVNGKRNRSTSE